MLNRRNEQYHAITPLNILNYYKCYDWHPWFLCDFIQYILLALHWLCDQHESYGPGACDGTHANRLFIGVFLHNSCLPVCLVTSLLRFAHSHEGECTDFSSITFWDRAFMCYVSWRNVFIV